MELSPTYPAEPGNPTSGLFPYTRVQPVSGVGGVDGTRLKPWRVFIRFRTPSCYKRSLHASGPGIKKRIISSPRSRRYPPELRNEMRDGDSTALAISSKGNLRANLCSSWCIPDVPLIWWVSMSSIGCKRRFALPCMRHPTPNDKQMALISDSMEKLWLTAG